MTDFTTGNAYVDWLRLGAWFEITKCVNKTVTNKTAARRFAGPQMNAA